MNRTQAREYINNLIHSKLVKAPKRISGYDTYVCPFCANGSGTSGTGISTRDGKHYKCFKCDFYGDYLAILRKRDNLSEKEAFERHGISLFHANMEMPERTASEPIDYTNSEPIDYTNFFLEAQKALRGNPEALAYLQSRGISAATAERFSLGYVSDWRSPAAVKNGKNPPPSQRLIIPTGSGSYLARAISHNTDPAYKLMKEGTADFFNKQALQGAVPVFITEAAIDALSIIEAGGEACALGSTSGVNKFLDLCRAEPPIVPLILSLDNDEAGQKAQEKLQAGLEALNIACFELNTSGRYKDPNEHLTSDSEAFYAIIRGDIFEVANQEAEAVKKKHLETAVAYHLKAFAGEIDASADTPVISTGFSLLDEALDDGLYAGLYVIGAISSLGKTTFVLQVADQIAKQGYDVLLFSLEMSRYELMAKSISRLTLENCGGKTANAKTTRGILAGSRRKNYTFEEKELIEKSIADYAEYSEYLYIHEGTGDIGVAEVRQEVQKHISFTGNTPVVIIDYLQILAPAESGTDKQNTDKAVLDLKRLSRDKEIPVIAISSFNRDNYTAPVNLASFKESGAIEYSSDILLGLQLAGMDELSQSDNKRTETIKLIESKKAADPRKAQLKVLKNRNGKTGVSLYYDYYPMFNIFKESEAPKSDAGWNNDGMRRI